MQKDLWQIPHIQEWGVALERDQENGGQFIGYDRDGLAIYRYAIDDLLDEWRKRSWSIILAGQTVRGEFVRLQEGDFRYIDYLGQQAVMRPFVMKVDLSESQMFFSLPIREANITVENEHGLLVWFYIYEQELEIAAHPADFTLEGKSND